MNDLITVFRMEEISIGTRIRLIEKLGNAINREHGANVSDDLVDELVRILKERDLLENYKEIL